MDKDILKLSTSGLSGTQSASGSDYSSLSGSSLVKNRSFLQDVRTYYESKGKTFANSSDMLDEWYTDRRWKDSNFGSAGKDLLEYENAGTDQALMTKLSKAWKNAPERGSFASQVWDYGSATIFDPINLVPYAGAASKAARVANLARAAGMTKKAAAKSAIVKGGLRGAGIEAVAGGAMGTGMEALQQKREIQQGLSTEYDYGRVATSGAIEGVFGGVLGGGIGAFASRNPAREGLSWSKSRLAVEIEIQTSDANSIIRDADKVLNDPLREPDFIAASEAKSNAKIELSKMQARVIEVEKLDADAEGLAARMAEEGGNTPENKAKFDETLKKFNDAVASDEIPDIPIVAPKPEVSEPKAAPKANAKAAPKAKAKAAPKAKAKTSDTTGDTTGDTGDTTEADGAEAPVNTEATGDTTGDTGDTGDNAEAAATVEPPVEAAVEAPVEAPAVVAVLEVPKIKGRKFKLDAKKDGSLIKAMGKGMATHKSKVEKANEKNATALEPLTQSDLEKIVASTPNGTKDGALAPAGRYAIRRYLAAREGRVASFRTAKKNASADAKVDDDSFANPAVAEVTTAKEDFAKAEAVAVEAEVEGLAQKANEALALVLKLAGSNPTRINATFRGMAGKFDEATAAAVRRRIDDHINIVLPVVNKLDSDAKVKEMRIQEMAQAARMYPDDLKYTTNRSADSTAKSVRALENDPQAGLTTTVSTDKKTGEKITRSKVSSILKPGVDVGDGRTVTEGAGIFRRENETLAVAEAQAKMDVSQGKNKAVYTFPARAGMQLLGVKGVGRGKRGVATEGQVVYAAMTQLGKSDSIFKVYASEKMALESLGLSKGEIGIDTSKITPIKTLDELDAAKDKAYDKFSKSDGDVPELEEDLAVIRAQGREGGLDVDPAPEVVVKDGRGNVVDNKVPDAPLTRDDKVMVLLPRTTEVAPRVVSKSQIAEGATVGTLLGGKPASLFRIGYVPAIINGKTAQSLATKRNLLRDNFEPLDESQSFDGTSGVTLEKEAEVMPARPLTIEETESIVIDISSLASDADGQELAQMLFVGDRLVNNGQTDNMIAADIDQFLKSKPTVAKLSANLAALERADFKMTNAVGGTETEIPVGMRIRALKAHYDVLTRETPHGVAKPAADIDASIASLNAVMSGVGTKISGQIERLMRIALPEDKAPLFTSPSDGGSAGNFYMYGPASPSYNMISLDMNSFDKDGTRTGISGSYTVMHEIAHWAYENLMGSELKGEFWENVSKFYDTKGKFDEGDMIGGTDITLLDRFTPSVELDGVRAGVNNGKTNPQEFFANQFSLYMHHKFDSPLATKNENVLKKAAKVIQKLWMHMTGRHIVDPNMELLFDKLIKNKDEARRVQFTFPVEPSTSIGRTLRVRFDQVQRSLREFEAAMDGYPETHDTDKMASTARMLSEAFNGMSMTKKTQGYLATKAGNNAESRVALEKSTGVLKLMSGKQLRNMRAIAKSINEFTVRSDSRISQTGDDMEVFGGAYHSDMDASLVDLYKSGMKDFTEELKTSMNDSYMDVEYGDIPEARISEGQLSVRAKYNITGSRLAKKQNFEQNIKRETNRQRRTFAQALTKAMVATGKNNAKLFKGEIVAGTKGSDANSYGFEESVREFQRQIGEDGVPTAFGKKLANRVKHLVNTKVDDVNLTEEELGIYHTWQSKTVGKGAKGLANAANIYDLTMALSITIDGGDIKGVAGTPEQIQNITRHIIKERFQAKKNKAAIKNKKVSDAIEVEQQQEVGVSFENGIPQNSNYTMRNFLRGITHRAQDIEYNARTLTARLARLDGILPNSVDDVTFRGFRKAVRAAGVSLSRDGDITPAIRLVSESLYGSNLVSQSAQNTISRYAVLLGREPADVFSEIVTESVDTLSPKTQMKAMHKTMFGEDAEGVENLFLDIESDVIEGLTYVMNGLVSSKPARNRFYSISFTEDVFSSGSSVNGSSRSKYQGNVPSEYASDYAYEVLDTYTPTARASIEEFTGGNTRVYFQNGASNGVLGRGSYVTARPDNTLAKITDDVISSAPEANQADVADMVEALADLRAQVNSARLDPMASAEYFDRMYALDDALVNEIGDLGANLDTDVRPVFIKDTSPAILRGSMNGLSPIVQAMNGHYVKKVSEGLGGRDQANKLKSIRGTFSPEQMLETLTEVAGSERALREVLTEMGYTSLNLGPNKMMLQKASVRDLRAPSFENATPLLGEGDAIPALNGAVVSSILNGQDPIKVFSQAAQTLENAGVQATTLDGMIAVARGKGLPDVAAEEIRKSSIYNPLRTNAKIMKRSGLNSLADFIEPEAGGGGHFERTNAKMGKFLMPMTRMLKALPDAGNKVSRYWQTGPVLMAESAMGAMGMSPKRRTSQPASHMRIVTALRDQNKAGQLNGVELETYTHIRTYLDNAIARLRASGNYPVGNIQQNYFPQVWRKDLIEADPEIFKKRVAKYFMKEDQSAGGSKPMLEDEAYASATRMVNKLLDNDGVLSSPSSSLKGTSGKGNEDSLDFSRMMRLDEFPDFIDFDNVDSLAPFLENDLLVSMTKYSDSLEHRIDLSDQYGAGIHGYHDYIAILSDPLHARQTITTLLTSNKILKTNYSRMGHSGEGMLNKVFDDSYFMAPVKDAFIGGKVADDLTLRAQNGASAAELEGVIMALLDKPLANSPEAAQMRKNFSKRASAIANALVDTKGLTKLTSKANVDHAQGFMNAAMRKPVDGAHGLYSMKNASKWLRGVNAVTLLSFTTLTSLADVVLPLIRTGDLKSYTKALYKYAREPAYRDMIRNVGAATENAVHQRLTVAHGVDSTQFMTGFFNSTLLTPWTDTMRDVAAAVSYEHVKAQHRLFREAKGTRQGRIARQILVEEGLQELIDDPNLDLDLIMESRGAANEHPLNDKLAASLIKLTNQMIFTPNPNDLPLWGATPLGAIAMQLKSYPLMMTRLSNKVVQDAFAGDTSGEKLANFSKAFVGQSDNRLGPLAALLVAGPAVGSLTVATKDVVQGRGGEDNREFALRERKLSKTLTTAFEENPELDKMLGHYFDGMVALGGLGLVGELMYDVVSNSDNGVYGTQRMFETIGGPTVGLFNDAMTVTQGARSAIDGKEANGERRAAFREVVGRVPVLGGVSWAKEALIDNVAGERSLGRPSTSTGFGSSFASSYGSGFGS